MQHATLHLVTLSERPQLLPIISGWLGDRRAGPASAEHCFILLAGGVPAGTASLAESGLETRPDLTPWLTNLFVPPAFRGRGYAQRLVVAVEAAARAGSWPTLWLVTRSASRLYARLGWQAVGPASFQGDPAILMRRDFGAIQNAYAYNAESPAT